MKLLISLISVVYISTLGYGQSIIPVTLYSTEDVQTFSGLPSQNYHTSPTTLAVSVNSSLQYYRTFLKFNLNSIPKGSIITSAKLRLTPSGTENISPSNSTQLKLGLCNSNWFETSLTHSSSVINNSVFSSIDTSSLVSGKREFLVTSHVQAIVDRRTLNNGWILRRTNETNTTLTTNYHSNLASGITNDPVLLVEYYTPCSITAVSINHASSYQNTDGSISPTITGGSSSSKTYTWYDSNNNIIATTPSLNGVKFGWYGLKVQGIHSSDVLYYAFLVGVKCESVNILFNPPKNYIDDATYSSLIIGSGNNSVYYNQVSNGNNSWISAEHLLSIVGKSQYFYKLKSLLRFRIWVDPALNITQANVTLNGGSHQTGVVGNEAVFNLALDSNWREFGLSELNRPTISNSIFANISTTTSSTQNANIDFTPFFNFWKNNNSLNYGSVFDLVTNQMFSSYPKQNYKSSEIIDRPRVNFTVNLISDLCYYNNYSEVKRELDGGFALVKLGKLYFFYEEEYAIEAGKNLPFKIFNKDRVLVASCELNGTTYPSGNSNLKLRYNFDDNSYVLNLSGLGLVAGQYYTLEIHNPSGEKRYLRFLYNN